MEELDKQNVPYSITLIVTEDCNLRCTYCFEHDKSRRYMTFEVAKRALDTLLAKDNGFRKVIIEFSGGEPLLNFELIQQVFYYARQLQIGDRELSFGIGTNGTMLTDAMKEWLAQYKCISVGLSLDGTKAVHDKNRSGSYDAILKNIDFFRRYNTPVKMTISPNTIPHLCQCIEHINDLGFPVEANVVFEDVWGTPQEKVMTLKTFNEELIKLVSLYDENDRFKPPFLIDAPIEMLLLPWDEDYRFCGSGRNMVAVDPEGRFYPCHRFAPMASSRPYGVSDAFKRVRPDKCEVCKIRRLCHSCLGYNYEIHEDVDHRTDFHCEFVKLQLKAAAKIRYRRIQRSLEGKYKASSPELRAMLDSILFVEQNIVSSVEICNYPLSSITN